MNKNKLNIYLSMVAIIMIWGCAHKPEYNKTVEQLDIQKFMGRWYVVAGRFTMFEKEVHNAIETYEYDSKKDMILIDFKYNKGGFAGPIKKIPQDGWIQNRTTNSHWKVSPLWPFKFDYLVIGLAQDYSWTVIGVPSQAYIWVMVRDYKITKQQVDDILASVQKSGYNVNDIVYVPHQY